MSDLVVGPSVAERAKLFQDAQLAAKTPPTVSAQRHKELQLLKGERRVSKVDSSHRKALEVIACGTPEQAATSIKSGRRKPLSLMSPNVVVGPRGAHGRHKGSQEVADLAHSSVIKKDSSPCAQRRLTIDEVLDFDEGLAVDERPAIAESLNVDEGLAVDLSEMVEPSFVGRPLELGACEPGEAALRLGLGIVMPASLLGGKSAGEELFIAEVRCVQSERRAAAKAQAASEAERRAQVYRSLASEAEKAAAAAQADATSCARRIETLTSSIAALNREKEQATEAVEHWRQACIATRARLATVSNAATRSAARREEAKGQFGAERELLLRRAAEEQLGAMVAASCITSALLRRAAEDKAAAIKAVQEWSRAEQQQVIAASRAWTATVETVKQQALDEKSALQAAIKTLEAEKTAAVARGVTDGRAFALQVAEEMASMHEEELQSVARSASGQEELLAAETWASAIKWAQMRSEDERRSLEAANAQAEQEKQAALHSAAEAVEAMRLAEAGLAAEKVRVLVLEQQVSAMQSEQEEHEAQLEAVKQAATLLGAPEGKPTEAFTPQRLVCTALLAGLVLCGLLGRVLNRASAELPARYRVWRESALARLREVRSDTLVDAAAGAAAGGLLVYLWGAALTLLGAL